MNARVRATSWLGGERVRATVNMLVERDGHLRFEAEISLQGTVAVLATDGTAFSLYDAHKNELSRGPACPANVASMIRIPLGPADVAAVLLGDGRTPGPIDPATASVGWDVRRGADVLAIPAREGGTLQFLFHGDGAARTLVAMDRIGTNGAPMWRTAYEDHEAVGAVRLPGIIRFAERTAASTTASRSSSRTDRSTPRRPPTHSRCPRRPAPRSSTSAAAPGPAKSACGRVLRRGCVRFVVGPRPVCVHPVLKHLSAADAGSTRRASVAAERTARGTDTHRPRRLDNGASTPLVDH